MPRHAVGDHRPVHRSAIDLDLSDKPLVAVAATDVHRDVLPQRWLGQPIAGLRAVSLFSLRGIDPLEPDFVLDVVAVDRGERVAVVDRDDLSAERLGGGLTARHCTKESERRERVH